MADKRGAAARVYLILDQDWAVDEAMAETLELLRAHRAVATFFVTSPSPHLAAMAQDPNLELGLHPAFAVNGQPDRRVTKPAKVLAQLRKLVPGAVSARAHGLVNSSPLLDAYAAAGLTHEASCFIPFQAGLSLRPWRLWNGLVRVPFSWEDDVNCLYGQPWSVLPWLEGPGLKVFAFHPIHVYLNTASLDDYQRAKPVMHDYDKLRRLRRPASLPGAARCLDRFLRVVGERDLAMGKISQIRPEAWDCPGPAD